MWLTCKRCQLAAPLQEYMYMGTGVVYLICNGCYHEVIDICSYINYLNDVSHGRLKINDVFRSRRLTSIDLYRWNREVTKRLIARRYTI
jgi:hypothetical protein